jgi:hypothetical protein
LTATVVCPPLVLPLFLGGLTIGALGVGSLWRHWDLVDRLADDRDAYVIPEVRAYAARDARMDRRFGHAAHIRSWIEQPSLPADVRVAKFADELEDLACALEDRDLELDPASAIACRRLVSDPTVSPLLDSALPPDSLRSSIARIRSGFTPRTRT